MRWEGYLAVVVIIFILGMGVMINHRTTPGFSKVYFDESTVPPYLSFGNNTTVIFIIESHENEEITYSFRVFLDGKTIKSGHVLVKPKDKAEIPVTFAVNNYTYNKIILSKKTVSYIVSGAINITGECVVTNSTSKEWTCLPAEYNGLYGLNFLLNTSRNVTVVNIISSNTNTTRIVTKSRVDIHPIGKDTFIVNVNETKVMYVPKTVNLEIIVSSSNGKTYWLAKHFQVVMG